MRGGWQFYVIVSRVPIDSHHMTQFIDLKVDILSETRDDVVLFVFFIPIFIIILQSIF